MRDDFAVFIITHERRKQVTYNLLKRMNYSGRLYFLVDDRDNTRFDLIKRFGEDRVIVFNKDDYLNEIDFVTNKTYWDTPVFVEHFMYDFAKEQGINYFIRCDDDISEIYYRYPEGGVLKQRKVKDIDSVFEAMVEFMETADLNFLSPAQNAAYIGGVNGNFSKGFDYKYSQMVFCSTKNRVDWRGFTSSDFLTIFDSSITGKGALRTYLLSITSPKRGENKGGMEKVYKEDSRWYMSNFLSVIVHPSSSKISEDDSGEIKGVTEYNYIYPKIISESYKHG